MNITRWEPFGGIDELLGRWPMFGRWPRTLENGGPALEWSPAADITETDKEYLVKADLPGMHRNDIEVSVDGGALTIRGERKEEKEHKEDRHHRAECSYGTFFRSFTLPNNVADSDIQAEFADGVLSVHLPKVEIETPKAKLIKIK